MREAQTLRVHTLYTQHARTLPSGYCERWRSYSVVEHRITHRTLHRTYEMFYVVFYEMFYEMFCELFYVLPLSMASTVRDNC